MAFGLYLADSVSEATLIAHINTLSGAYAFDKGTVPQALPAASLPAGTGRFFASSDPRAVTILSAAVPFFTMGATGPYFRPGGGTPSGNLPGPLNQIRFVVQCERPSGVTPTGRLFSLGANGLRFSLAAVTGSYSITPFNVRIGGSDRTITWTGGVNPAGALSNDVLETHEWLVDAAALTISYTRNGGTAVTGTLSGLTGTFDNSVPAFMAAPAGTSLVTQGFRVARAEIYVNGSSTIAVTSSVNTQVSGNAATVNVHPWKTGGDAT